MIGELEKDAPRSDYSAATEGELDLTMLVKKDYSTGHNILTREWTELNNSNVIEDMNRGRRMFNAFVDEDDEDSDDSWKWKGTRSVARNKGIAMHANLTAAYILPMFRAQNTEQEVDRGASEFMTDLVEWMADDQNSDYKENFLSLIFATETDPIVYLGAEYNEVMQEVKILEEDGRYTKKEIMDEVLSGFKAPIYTADQILISNAFERNLQKHAFNIKRRWIEYQEAKAMYGEHPNFDFVKPGVNVVYNEDDSLFYEIKDEEHPSQVEEVSYRRRRDDVEVCYIGGIYMGDQDVDNNRIQHRDNFDAPRYNVQQFGYYPIGSHFVYYKSMMAALRWDNQLYDAMAEIAMNRAILEVDFPVAVSGTDKYDGEIVYPNAVVTLENPEARVQKLMPDSNLTAIFSAMAQTKESMSEASVNETVAGQLPAADQKAFNVAQAQANAKKIMGGVAKGIALSVSRYGLLMSDIAINNFSVPQVDALLSDDMKLKYRSFVLDNKQVGGRRVSKLLTFDPSLETSPLGKKEGDEYNLKLLEKSGYPDTKQHIYAMNPKFFAERKYLSIADYKEVFAGTDETMQALLTNLYLQLRGDPNANSKDLLRETMYYYFRSKGDKFIAPDQPAMPGAPVLPGAGLLPPGGKGGGDQVGGPVMQQKLSTVNQQAGAA